MKYSIKCLNTRQHLLEIELSINEVKENIIHLQIPAWRPGRYELSNYAKNIPKVIASDNNGNPLTIQKISRERCEIHTQGNHNIHVRYAYYAQQMDAGGSWLDESLVYINFINCMMYIPGREKQPCEVDLLIPDNYSIACGLQHKGSTLYAKDFYELADSPLIASKDILHHQFSVRGIPFHIWIQGDCNPDWQKIEYDFSRFASAQIEVFGSFPEKEYHFLFHILPYRHYHGVEHRNSTVITLGPAELFSSPSFYENFLGISSHELFHAWNICKIRPQEMLPYNFTGENYYRSGFIAEGLTTYYGDLFLARSGVFSPEQFLKELNTICKRYFENFGRSNLSVADSSFDLWVDGYSSTGMPNRKVSIYDKGALIALLTDLIIRSKTQNSKSLDDLMKIFWSKYGTQEKGYTIADFQKVVESLTLEPENDLVTNFIYGTEPIEKILSEKLDYVGCQLKEEESTVYTEKLFGFRTVIKDGRTYVDRIQPYSPGEEVLELEDEILAVDSLKVTNNIQELIAGKREISIAIFRKNKLKNLELRSSDKTFYTQFSIQRVNSPTAQQQENFKAWIYG